MRAASSPSGFIFRSSEVDLIVLIVSRVLALALRLMNAGADTASPMAPITIRTIAMPVYSAKSALSCKNINCAADMVVSRPNANVAVPEILS